ncbi:MAG TPA: anthranilate phosphoribosyltransferase [Solirubrobacteraceae bacterium]|nr:anthranilate phosphoribosyltransferase [Solirubrobacteraceae bacterium]
MSELLTRAIDSLADRRDLSETDAAEALAEIMAGEASDIEIAGFLLALRVKGETVEELAGLARTMRALAAFVPTAGEDLVDTAGTGGGRRTFNVSTTAALIAAGAGCMVAKHGSRSSTGLSGSADVLEALGAKIDLDAAGVGRCIEEIGFGFMFAPYHHPATRRVVEVRKQLKVRTTFNFLGPLTNPAGANRQLLGVSDPATLPKLAGALALLGTRHAMLVCSEDSLDELSVCAATRVIEISEDGLSEYSVNPEDLGLPRHPADAVPGGDPQENAEIARRIFAGEPGAARDVAVLNAGAAIYVGGRADSLLAGVLAAQEAIDTGAATAKLEAFVALTQELSALGNGRVGA